jgi:hypothetical protein
MIKLSELAKYCESIDADCWHCEKKDSCKRMTDYVEEATPIAIIDIVKNNKEF